MSGCGYTCSLLITVLYVKLELHFFFSRQWRDFKYKPRTIRFANEAASALEKDGLPEIKLPQFSSAAVPKVSCCTVSFHRV